MIEFLSYKAVVGIIVVLAGLAVYRFFFSQKSAGKEALEREYEEILTSDKYKVKGQWETVGKI
ncbi:MAG TPA: hypothetical protein VFE88_02150 [Candidatus Nanoarchaeia archaeon]|nr:hypothetical protein [Candidatus Nanoarchaeia archaeon]